MAKRKTGIDPQAAPANAASEPAAARKRAGAAGKPAAPAARSEAGSGSEAGGKNRSGASRPTHEQISQRAFEIWVAKGRPSGQDAENWQQAERELASSGR